MSNANRFIKNGDYYYFGKPPKHISGITLNKSEIQFDTIGQTEQLIVSKSPADAVENIDITWSSSDTSIATVDSNGLVTCVSLGDCTITAIDENSGLVSVCNVKERKDIYIDFLLVAGGGAGGAAGGGAGGVIQCCGYCITGGNSFSIVIGCGGCRAADQMTTCNGGNSTFNGLTAYGGGGGGYWGASSCKCPAKSGGSGGGGMCCQNTTGGSGCSGQGYKGGNGSSSYATGGGGGAGGCGCNASSCVGGMGGIGIQSDISGTSIWYAGGGSGMDGYYGCNVNANCGGAQSSYQSACNAKTNNSYYGGGGGAVNCYDCGRGHSGIFILRYPTACGYCITGGTKYTSGTYTIHCFTSNGTLTVN